jgi:amidohydrolase
MFDAFNESQDQQDYVIGIRRHLHINPELTGKEFNTVRMIKDELTKMGISYINIPDGGVIGIIEGDKPGRTILLRADCDALPMKEYPQNGGGKVKPCISCVEGAAHMCGHDAHTAMLLGVAKVLSTHCDEIEGKVFLLFERGEEGGYRIYYIIKYIQEHNLNIDACYGIHVSTDLAVGQYSLRSGAVSAGGVNFEVQLIGKGGHGSRPDLSNNPIECFVAIHGAISDIRMKYTNPLEPVTCNICMVRSGTRRNIVPENLIFKGTSRFYDLKTGRIIKSRLDNVFKNMADLYDCELIYDNFAGPGFPLINNPVMAEIGRDALEKLVGVENVKQSEPSMGSDSFSTLAAYYPSSMIRLGSGNPEKGIIAGAHNPQFDVDEDCLKFGVAAYVAVALNYLKKKPKIDFTPFAGTADDMLRFANRKVPERFDV